MVVGFSIPAWYRLTDCTSLIYPSTSHFIPELAQRTGNLTGSFAAYNQLFVFTWVDWSNRCHCLTYGHYAGGLRLWIDRARGTRYHACQPVKSCPRWTLLDSIRVKLFKLLQPPRPLSLMKLQSYQQQAIPSNAALKQAPSQHYTFWVCPSIFPNIRCFIKLEASGNIILVFVLVTPMEIYDNR